MSILVLMSKLCTFHIEYTPKLCLPLPKTLHTSSVSCSSLCWKTVAFFLWLHWGEDCIEKVPSFSIHSVTWTSQSLRTMWTIVFWCKPFFFFLQLLVNCIFYIYIYIYDLLLWYCMYLCDDKNQALLPVMFYHIAFVWIMIITFC